MFQCSRWSEYFSRYFRVRETSTSRKVNRTFKPSLRVSSTSRSFNQMNYQSSGETETKRNIRSKPLDYLIWSDLTWSARRFQSTVSNFTFRIYFFVSLSVSLLPVHAQFPIAPETLICSPFHSSSHLLLGDISHPSGGSRDHGPKADSIMNLSTPWNV